MTIEEKVTQIETSLRELNDNLKDKFKGSSTQRLIWRRRRNDLKQQLKNLK
jgi:hypothetical protein